MFNFVDACCYHYESIPGNKTCNPQGQIRTVILGCGVYAPNDSIADVRVRWYRRKSEDNVGSSGQLVTTLEFDASEKRAGFDFPGVTLVRLPAHLNITSEDSGIIGVR